MDDYNYISRKPFFSTTCSTPFQLQFLVENNKLSWKILFAIENHGSQQIQVENDNLVENISHVLTLHQSPLQTILVVNDIDYYN
jgi:hypothetical protein